MSSDKLKRAAAITAIIAVASLLLATVIGIASGKFHSVAEGASWLLGRDGAGNVAVDQKQSVPLAGAQAIVIRTVNENIMVHETSGDSITARLYGKVSSADLDDRPRLEINRNGATVGICVKRRSGSSIGLLDNAALDVGIPKGYAGRLSAEGVSGDITLGGNDCRDLALVTVSGDIEAGAVRAVTKNLDARSISGDVVLAFAKMPDSIAAKTVSGDLQIALPSDAGFALDSGSTSGDVTCDFPITLTSSNATKAMHKLAGTVGTAKGTITAHTVSGDINITRKGGI